METSLGPAGNAAWEMEIYKYSRSWSDGRAGASVAYFEETNDLLVLARNRSHNQCFTCLVE